ncbi:MAG: hypothetical protein ACOZNI_23120 [Myxococcota bacterium]
MDCGLADVLAAKAGLEEPADPRMLAPPPFFDGRVRPRADGKGVYGQPLPNAIDTENFTVQWDHPDVDPDRAAEIAEALEAGWAALVEAGGWPQPVSSDQYLLWVILDPTISGSGFTTTYETDAYPDGYPVLYVNPDFAPGYPGFERSVSVHEFGHALQFGLRDWWTEGTDAWYWEATSEWVAELGLPDADTYALSTYWYAVAPEASFDSTVDSHQYGMLLLNAYLDEYEIGAEGIRDVWIAGEGGGHWEDLIAEATGRDFGDVVADMTGAYAAGALRESPLYYEPTFDDPVWTSDLPGRYGTHYVDLGVAMTLDVTGDVEVRYVLDGGWSEEPPGDVVTFTAVARRGEYGYGELVADVEDDCLCADEAPPEAPAGGCASATASVPPWVLLILARARGGPPARARSRRAGPPAADRSPAPS